MRGLHFDTGNGNSNAVNLSPMSFSSSLNNVTIHNSKFTNWTLCVNLNNGKFNNFIFSNNRIENSVDGLYIQSYSESSNFSFRDNVFIGTSGLGIAVVFEVIPSDTLPWSGVSFVGNSFSNFGTALIVGLGGFGSNIELDSNSFINIGNLSIFINNVGSIRTSIDDVAVRGNQFSASNTSRAIQVNLGGGSLDSKIANVEISNNQISNLNNEAIFINVGGTGVDNLKLYQLSIKNNNIQSCNIGIHFSLGGTGNCQVDMDTVYVQNNTIDNCNFGIYTHIYATGFFSYSVSNVAIDSNVVSNGNLSGIEFGISPSSISGSVSNIFIRSNEIYNNISGGIIINGVGFSTAMNNISNISIHENSIYNNSLSGINVDNYMWNMRGVNFRRNSIYGNGLRGIVTTDFNNGYANPVIPVAVLDSVVYGSINGNLYGHLSSQPLTKYIAEIFTNSIPDSSGFGEGETFLDTVGFVTDASGYAQFQISVPLSTSSLYFSATVTDSVENCTSPFSITISSLTTVLNEVSEQELLIYPNPTSNMVFVSIPPSSKIHQIDLMNLTGQVISRFDVKEGESVLNFSTLNYPNGCYFLKAFGETSLLNKLIIQHD
ncbi:MAG: T9SS type A sorting domain-containing protein [Bacteroidetes bacterium]|nr:T9SS type A sorting domain-containing protein [Bacteroidota bacterium]